jgi:succinoglycan biosynthesis transport protein ExoP
MSAIQPQLPPPRSGRQLVETGYRAPAIATTPTGTALASYEPLIDVHGIWQALYRNRYLILVVVGAALALGALWTALSPRVYEATAKVEIGQEVESPLGNDGSGGMGSQEVDRMLQTQVDLLRTRDMANAVLERIASRGGNYEQLARGFTPEALQGGVDVYLPRSSRVVSINYTNQDPQLAALMANYYAETLIERNLQTRFNASAYAREFLQRQLGIAKARLEQSERALIAYARSAGLLDASGGGSGDKPTSLTSSNLISLNAAYSAAQSARIQAQQKWVQAMSTPVMSLPDVLTNPTIQQMSQQRAAELVKLQELRQKYQDEHPAIKQELASLAELDRQIQATAVSIRESIHNQYLQAQRQETALAQGVGQLKGATLSEQDQSVQYNILKRETDTNRQLYDGLLQRYKQISAEAGVTTNNIVVVDRAVPPTSPISPDPEKNLSLAGVGGILFAFLLVFARERFDTRVSSPEWVDHDVSVHLLGVIPLVTDGGAGEAILDTRSPLSEACHSLRTSIELGVNGSMPSSILLTSTKSQEGKSTTALGLAHAFAEAGARVLLIDGDLRKPSLHALLGVENSRGFSDVLAGRLNLQEAVTPSESFKIDLLTAGPRPDSPAALLDPERLKAAIAESLKIYDQVIIDGPPVMGIADATRLAAAVTATIFVLKSKGVTKEEARMALRHLQSEHIDVIGAVLTMFDARRTLGSSYYTYGYPEPVA